jgi:hypothetical protein
MPLVETIRDLASRIQADLDASHDYFEHTKGAWRLVELLADEGRPIIIQNPDTGTVADAAELAGRAQGYVTGYLAESVFQHFVALLEDFVFGLLNAWLTAHPSGIPRKDEKSVDLATILDAPDKNAIIQVAVDRELDGLKYKRPVAWFRYLNDRVKLGGPTDEQIERLAEIKASRDILVHNRGIVNETYLDKAGLGFEGDGLNQVSAEDKRAVAAFLRVGPLNRGVADSGYHYGTAASLTFERCTDAASRGSIWPKVQLEALRVVRFHSRTLRGEGRSD